MVKVLYVVSTLQRTGPISFLYNLLEETDRRLLKPIILTLSTEKESFPSLRKDFIDLGTEIISLDLSRLEGFLFAKSKIKKIVEANGIEVIHTIGYRADTIINKRSFNKQMLVSSIQSNIFDDYPMLYGKFKGDILAKSHIKNLKGKIAVSCSFFVAESIKKNAGLDSEIVYNSVSKNKYITATIKDKIRARQNLGLPEGAKIFILSGFLIFRKDPITAINGFLEAKLANSFLVILGEGPLLETCLNKVGDNDNVVFKGYVSNVIEYLKAADFYISSSMSEGLPFSVIEAFACGIPCILSNIKPHSELIGLIENWEYAHMFNVKDYFQLSKLLKYYNALDYNALSYSFRNVVATQVNSQIMAGQYLEIYNKYKTQ